MKNLSKVLAVVLAFAMALSMVSFAAYTDVAEDANYSEAVAVLSDLKILTGYEDGSFKPEATITRAEFATVVIRMLGLADSASGGAEIFTDVAADHWANGYIALAAQQGIVNGYGDGRFGPEDPVKYQEAIKMVVAALGYTPMADANGGYPGGYKVVASQRGILAGVTGAKDNEAATRAIVAQLAYNSLAVPLMEQTGFGTQTNFQAVDSLLLNKLGVTKFVGAIVGTSASDSTLKAGEVKVRGDLQITAVSGKYTAQKFAPGSTINISNPQVSNTYDDTTGVTIDVAAGVEEAAKALLDEKVVMYIKDAAELDVAELVSVVKDGNKSVAVEFMAEDFKAVKDSGSNPFDGSAVNGVDATLEVYTDTATGEYEEYSVNIDKVYINGQQKYCGIGSGSPYNTNGAIAAANYDDVVNYYITTNGGKNVDVKLLSNKNEGIFNVAYLTVWTDAVVESVSERNWRVYTDAGTYVLDETDTKKQKFTIYKDGEVASFADIAENDVLSIAGYKNGSNLLEYGDVYIVSDKVEGTVTGRATGSIEEIKVDGTTYKTAGTVKNDVKLGDKAVFYVNARGVLVDLDKTSSSTNLKYGFASYIYVDPNFGDAMIRIMTADGVWSTVDLASKIKSVIAAGNDTDSFDTASIDWDGTKTSSDSTDDVAGVAGKIGSTSKYAVNNVVAYELNDKGEIKTLFLTNYNTTVSGDQNANKADFSDGYFTADNDAEYVAATGLLGAFELDETTTIFSYKAAVAGKIGQNADISATEEKAITVVASSTLADRVKYNITDGYNVDKDTNIWTVLVGQDIEPGIDWTSDFFVVSDLYQTTNELGEMGYMITGLVAGEEKSLFVNDEDSASVKKVVWADNGPTVNSVADTEDDIHDNVHATKNVSTDIAKGDVLIYSLNAKGEANEVYILLDASDMIVTAGNDANYKYLTAGISNTTGYVGNVKVGTTDYHFVLGYVKDRSGSNVTLVGGNNTAANIFRFSAETIGAAYDAHTTNVGKVIDAVYGDAVPDPKHGTVDATKDGDFIFARVSNNVVVDDFVIISNKR